MVERKCLKNSGHSLKSMFWLYKIEPLGPKIFQNESKFIKNKNRSSLKILNSSSQPLSLNSLKKIT